jgi:hypothetical protein
MWSIPWGFMMKSIPDGSYKPDASDIGVNSAPDSEGNSVFDY